MRRAAMLLACLAGLAGGCTTTYSIRPAQGGDVAALSSSGLTIVADPNAWDGQPYDLPNYMTPIAVRITNNSGQDIRVSYADFALVNDRGFRYSAVNPYGLMGERPVGQLASSPGLLLTSGSEQPQAVPAVTRVYRYPRHGRLRVHPGRRFFVYPRYRHSFRYYDPWPYGWRAPYYGPHVTLWTNVYPSQPSGDVLRLGLPEGVVRAGGQISGFLYFQSAGQRSDHLELTWSAHTPDGRTVATMKVPFVVVPD